MKIGSVCNKWVTTDCHVRKITARLSLSLPAELIFYIKNKELQ